MTPCPDILTADECALWRADQSVGGVPCDGTIVIDASGRRCVPASVVAEVDRVAAASSPTPAPPPASGAGQLVPLVGVAVAFAVAVGVIVALASDD